MTRPIMPGEADHLDQPVGLIGLLHPLLARAGGGDVFGGGAAGTVPGSVVQEEEARSFFTAVVARSDW